MPSGVASKTYGTVPADMQKEMTGLEFVQGTSMGRCRSTRSPKHWAMTSPRQRAGVS
jgi:hypothetical protein